MATLNSAGSEILTCSVSYLRRDVSRVRVCVCVWVCTSHILAGCIVLTFTQHSSGPLQGTPLYIYDDLCGKEE